MVRRLLIVLVIVAASCTVCLTKRTIRNAPALFQRGDPRTSRTGEHEIADEDERYVPASFNIDDGTSNGGGLQEGHAIEVMAPVEVHEYGWNRDSRGLSELDHGVVPVGNRNPGRSEELTGRGGGLVQCGERQIESRHAVCCDGLVYRKNTEQDSGKCCGSVAYDDRYFTCCQGRAIVRKNGQLPLCCGDYSRDTLPDQCKSGYENDTTGLGSTCCRSNTGAWKCCIRGESCCTSSSHDRSTVIDVPGFRPACCHLANEELTSRCCAVTYEKVGVLPDCCNSDRLTPVCCKKPASTAVKCCPGTIGYCCGTDESEDRATEDPWPLIQTTRHPLHPPHVTHPPRPIHTDRQTRYPGITYAPQPIYSTGLPYPERTQHTGRTQPPYPRYTTRYDGRFPGEEDTGTSRYPPGQTSRAPPACCRSKTQQKPCCSKTRSPTCCRPSLLPRCCFTIYFNVTCCRSHMQQGQQQRVGNPQINGASGVRLQLPAANDVEVQPARETEQSQTNGNHQPQVHHLSSNGNNSNRNPQQNRQCCRLETPAATACCQNGYQETGLVLMCCISSPDEPNDARDVQSVSDEIQGDAAYVPRPTALRNDQHRHLNATSRPSGLDERRNPLETCNGVAFNAEERICCNNTLRQRIGIKPACCNSVGYDSSIYKCCEGKVRISCNSDYKPKKSMWGVLI